ncbi:hypothetical protein DO97_14875 [Neosynechococcus sphagnicola sy1]|uniref:Probable endolytic peptidoglycan transglycosylase RlpA n=1 Tax=Neosynechococcus sphagnicola sy1 TaxID=1497020 RepID=A0A098TIM2_9CYAN|nr:septal ring lytic transglycosylase RlpA family protein [Neosynechococcus sphagnicola]KGF71832.1 hypothetical protein DO97_14875 [Neosynechococcus sphagnicola sy1]
MNQKHWNGLKLAILVAALGTAYASQVKQSVAVAQGQDTIPSSGAVPFAIKPLSQLSQVPTSIPLNPAQLQRSDVVKVGERQAPSTPQVSGEIIAKIQPHEWSGRKAATLYVRNLPILTFLGSGRRSSQTIKMGTPGNAVSPLNANVKSAVISTAVTGITAISSATSPDSSLTTSAITDPVWRATAVAAQLNQLSRDKIDPTTIKVQWKAEPDATGVRRDRYTIEAGGRLLVTLDSSTLVPGKQKNSEATALQVANRLRRLLGNAPPLREVAGKPRSQVQQIAFGPVRFQLSGMASWYGPGFHGSPSASGEPFNQYDLTAAHRSLPFGTRVRVFNVDNGRSVVVRINDRGPFSHGRIIDLSTAAAQTIGLVSSGVAPVRLEVLGQ